MKVWPLAEAPKSYILFSGMAMLGASLGRRVYLDLDVHRLYPLLNLLLIGPSGIGKSTALRDIALKNLVGMLPLEDQPQVITGKTTKEALHQDLMTNPHSIIMASELANLFSKEKYQEGMIPYVTDLLDLEPARIRTKSGGSLVVLKPECCILGGSTKAWLQDMLPNNAGEGGFLPRFFIVKEDHKFQRVADPRRMQTERQREALAVERIRVQLEFARILRVNEGLIDFKDYDASDAYAYWYNTFLPESGALAPFAARAGAHVLRLALLVALSRRQSSISAEDVQAGVCLHRYAQKKLSEVIIPMSPAGKNLNRLLDLLGDARMSDIEIRRAMRNHCGAHDTDRMVADLVSSKEIVLDEGKYRRVRL
jgi:hypothetical protein